MNYYTEDFWQAEMLNPSLYNTVINNILTDKYKIVNYLNSHSTIISVNAAKRLIS